jgi:exopolysaccharide biosynthesis protein
MMNKKHFMRGAMSFLLAGALTIQPLTMAVKANDTTYYEKITQKQVTSGLTYETKAKLTSRGWVDIHVLKMDLNNPYVDLDILRSSNVFGEKLTVTSMVNQSAKAVAGVNASFFNMKENPSDIIGAEYKDGYVVLQDLYNHYDKGVASLIQTEESIFLDFFSGDVRLRNSAGLEMDLYGINKINVQVKPVIFDQKAVKTTAESLRINNTYKMVVVDGVIIDHKMPMENVAIPANGYIISMYKGLYEIYFETFKIGEQVNLSVANSMANNTIKMILSGGGKIIENGALVEKGTILTKNTNAPRTAVGITQNKDYLIAMVVDGRGQSIGTTHAELGRYLLEYGAYDAIHYDGGGSSSMVSRPLGTFTSNLVNKPSDGTERKVVNALGFVTTAPAGQLESLVLVPNKNRTTVNQPITFTVLGYDEYYNPIAIDQNSVTFAVDGLRGNWNGMTYVPTVSGKGTVFVNYNGRSTSTTINAIDSYIGLTLGHKVLQIPQNGTGQFSLLATDRDGYKTAIDFRQATYIVENPSLGQFTNGVFKAGQNVGTTKVTIGINGIEATGYIIVGDQKAVVTDFENVSMTTMVYPETAKGQSTLDKTQLVEPSQKTSVKLDYSFKKAEMTQAVYTVFGNNPIIIPSRVNSLSLQLYGNNSGLMFRGKIVDSKNVSHLITFTNAIDFTGWKKLTAAIPAEVSYPFTIERLYVASVNAKADIQGSLYFDKLEKSIPFETSHLEGYDINSLKDPLQVDTSVEGKFNVSVFGATGGRNTLLDEVVMAKAYEVMNQSDLAIYSGYSNVEASKIKSKTEVWQDQFKVSDYPEVKVIHLSTSKNSLYKTDTAQIKKLETELANTDQKHIILVGNNSPVKTGDFTDKREAGLIHSMLRDYKEKTGKNVFYINAKGYTFGVNYLEGIRYVDMNGLWYNAQGRSLNINNQFYVLNFYMDQNELQYKIENLFTGNAE